MKTPGVYVVERDAFPNSVVEVATAVPAFIGYTERATNGGTSLAGRPWRISSMAEYIRYFGGPPKPVFTLTQAPGTSVAEDSPHPGAARAQVATIHWDNKAYTLTRAAAEAGGRYLMYQAMLHFFQNGGGPCYIVSVGLYDKPITRADLVRGLEPLTKEQEPTLVLTPDAVLLSASDCISVQAEVLAHCGGVTKSRFAILDIWGGDRDIRDPDGNCIESFRNDVGTDHLEFGAAYYPWLHTTLIGAKDLDYTVFPARTDLVAFLKADLKLDQVDLATEKDLRVRQQVQALQDMLLDDPGWVARLEVEIDADAAKPADEKARLKVQLDDSEQRRTLLDARRVMVQKSAIALSSFFKAIMERVQELVNLMPPAAAMAGLYTMVDNTRGVWKAPANVSVAGVIKPAVEISDANQEDLNVTPQGKSINAIRAFVGEGVLVWGARTLAGNSLDWRYINVRRTMIMLEQSCQLAAKAMVFEPNETNTWVTIRSMISNFLTSVWKRGGLAGAVPEDAFSVQVGLGQTMTAEDIVEGILRVTILVAVSRPAEFIEITFQQQQQKS